MIEPLPAATRVEPPPEAPARQNRELAILHSVATALNGSVDLAACVAVALSHVAELLDLRTGWVWLLDEASGGAYLAAAQNLPPGLRDRPQALAGACSCLDSFRRGRLEEAADVLPCSRLKWLSDGTDGLRFHASVPLRASGKKLGVINVASEQWRELSSGELRLLHTVGDMLGIAIERARLFARSVEIGAVEERVRLAREIHDTLAQGLSATALQLETAESLLQAGAGREQVQDQLGRALATTRQNLEEARRSVLDLRAAPLQGRTLVQALEGLCAEVGSGSRLSVRFRAEGDARPLPARIESGLHRIAQEALSNALLHAGARVVCVELLTEPDRVQLSVEDDGGGFLVEDAPAGHFGLIGMRERARLLDGELRVDSAPGAGTRVEAVIPLR